MEALLFLIQLVNDLISILFKLRIDRFILVDNLLRNEMQATLRYSQVSGKAYRSANKPAQNISLVRIGRGYSAGISQYKRRAPDMVCDNSKGAGGLLVVAIFFPIRKLRYLV